MPNKRPSYVVFSARCFESMAKSLCEKEPQRFSYKGIAWDKYPDGTDKIKIEGFSPRNEIAGEHILFFASFHDNDVTMSQFSIFIVLLQSFIESLTIILPYFPVGTNERVEEEGSVATANTFACFISSLPSCGRPIRLMIYDIHSLAERFYFHNNTIASLHSAVPLLFQRLESTTITSICFPDDGAAKRFRSFFIDKGYEIIICGKVREGEKRKVKIQDGVAEGKEILIVDDLVQTGGTLHECAVALKNSGAKNVSAFVVHGVFPNSCWQHFLRGASKDVFDKFWLTNSIPTVTSMIPTSDVFEILDLLPQVMRDVDRV